VFTHNLHFPKRVNLDFCSTDRVFGAIISAPIGAGFLTNVFPMKLESIVKNATIIMMMIVVTFIGQHCQKKNYCDNDVYYLEKKFNKK